MKDKKRKFVYPVSETNPERQIPEEIYPVIDTDLARDNLENHIPQADLEDL